MEPANNVAKLRWNVEEGRFELRILNQLKAHSTGDTEADHEIGRQELVKLARDKGYTVIREDV